MAKHRTRAKSRPEVPESELVVAIDDVETEPDEALVDEAVAQIRKILADTLYKGATTVGAYVLATFFDNDPAQVRSRHPKKGASFRALAERCESQDLPIKRSWLHSAVGVAVMHRQLPGGGVAFKQLPPALQTTLLPLREPDKVEKVAQRAVAKKLSLRDLRAVVKAERERARDPNETRGRRARPLIVKALDAATKAFKVTENGRLYTTFLIDEIEAEEMAQVVKTAKMLIGKLQGLVDKIEQRAASEE